MDLASVMPIMKSNGILKLAFFILSGVSTAHAITLQEKAERLDSAMVIARQYVRDALANTSYMKAERRSSVAGGPKDIRAILKAFLLEMSEDKYKSRLVFDGSGESARACPVHVDRMGAVAGGGGRIIYICNSA